MVATLQLKQDENAVRKADMERHLASVLQVAERAGAERDRLAASCAKSADSRRQAKSEVNLLAQQRVTFFSAHMDTF